jgi:hypothetical protein
MQTRPAPLKERGRPGPIATPIPPWRDSAGRARASLACGVFRILHQAGPAATHPVRTSLPPAPRGPGEGGTGVPPVFSLARLLTDPLPTPRAPWRAMLRQRQFRSRTSLNPRPKKIPHPSMRSTRSPQTAPATSPTPFPQPLTLKTTL